jgi:hypothetical protein
VGRSTPEVLLSFWTVKSWHGTIYRQLEFGDIYRPGCYINVNVIAAKNFYISKCP